MMFDHQSMLKGIVRRKITRGQWRFGWWGRRKRRFLCNGNRYLMRTMRIAVLISTGLMKIRRRFFRCELQRDVLRLFYWTSWWNFQWHRCGGRHRQRIRRLMTNSKRKEKIQAGEMSTVLLFVSLRVSWEHLRWMKQWKRWSNPNVQISFRFHSVEYSNPMSMDPSSNQRQEMDNLLCWSRVNRRVKRLCQRLTFNFSSVDYKKG